MSKDERYQAITYKLYLGYLNYANFYQDQIKKLESQLNNNELPQNSDNLSESTSSVSEYSSSTPTNNTQHIPTTSCNSKLKDDLITKKSPYYSEEHYSITNQQTTNNKRVSCESLEKLRIENDLELQKENFIIYDIHANRMLQLHDQLKNSQGNNHHQCSSTLSGVTHRQSNLDISPLNALSKQHSQIMMSPSLINDDNIKSRCFSETFHKSSNCISEEATTNNNISLAPSTTFRFSSFTKEKRGSIGEHKSTIHPNSAAVSEELKIKNLRNSSGSFLNNIRGNLLNSINQSIKFAVSSGDKNNRDNICIQMEVANMMGRLQVEIKGIIGFARLANGDSFEITIKHGSQKIKSRGKTMTDKTQIWDINTLMIDCLPNHPLDVKVQEIKFFKSKVLSERSFDPSNFLTTTSQLVTMNLNSSGTIKLQFIITWIPLLSSKTRAAAQPMPCVNPTLIRSATQLSSNAFTSPLLTIKNSTSFSGTHTLNRHLTTKKNQQIVPDKLPKTRVILRDKKRNKSQHNDFGQKDQWRASTTLLDSAYNDLSKSIPTLDSLSALKELSRSRSNLDSGKGYVEENDVKEKRISKFFTTKLSAANKGKKNWARSLSMHQLTTPHSPPSPKAESVTLNGSQDESDTGLKHRTKNESYFNSTTSNSSGIGSEVSSHSELGLKTIDQLLGIIDTLRRKISDLRSAELVEINAFEAGMLSWESVLKFNRANLIEDRKCGKLSKSRGMPNGYAKRDTLYNALNSLKTNDSSHMPHLDNLDDNILLDSYNDSIVNKNDSGIYISKPSQMTSSIGRSYYGQVSPNTSDRVYQNASTLNGSCGPSQRRFKQFRERRKSIGLVFDQSSVSDSSSSSNMWSNGQDTHTPDYGFDFYKSATSNGQLDDCLKHHLNHALEGINRLTVILTKSPFEYKLNQLLLSLDNDTSALEEMMLINDNLPNIPNVSNMLSELGVDCEVQELWLGICYTLSSFLIVPRKEMTHKIHSFVYPIVTGRYPDLVDQVVTNFMALMCDETYWNSQFISLYQFISMVRGKPLKNYFENMAHEAWIKGTLKSNDPQLVNEIMFRLSNVPMLPPLESLRSIALVMLSENTDCTRPIVNYLVNSNGELSQDLTSCFLMLLEHDDHSTRRAACRVLSILRPPNVLKQLEYVMNNDPSDYVRKEAKYTLSSIGFNANEITNL